MTVLWMFIGSGNHFKCVTRRHTLCSYTPTISTPVGLVKNKVGLVKIPNKTTVQSYSKGRFITKLQVAAEQLET